MKTCQEHRHLSREALRAAGFDAEPYREKGQPHTPRSALRQVVQSAAYARFGKRSTADDFCPWCAFDDPEGELAKCVDEVARHRTTKATARP